MDDPSISDAWRENGPATTDQNKHHLKEHLGEIGGDSRQHLGEKGLIFFFRLLSFSFSNFYFGTMPYERWEFIVFGCFRQVSLLKVGALLGWKVTDFLETGL